MSGMIGVPPRPLASVGAPVRLVRQLPHGAEEQPDAETLAEAAAALAAHDEDATNERPVAVATLGVRIARRFFDLCENPRTRERVMGAVRGSADSAVGGRLLVALLSRTVLTPLLRSRRVDGVAVKVEVVAAQLAGVAVLRYVTRMEPLASMPVEDLVAMVGPALQATLDQPAYADH